MNSLPALPRRFLFAWLVLIALVVASLGLSYLPLGGANAAVLLGIAAVQATLVIIFLIKLPSMPRLNWVFAGAGLFWLLFLFALSGADYSTRPPPGVESIPSLTGSASPSTGTPAGLGGAGAPEHRD